MDIVFFDFLLFDQPNFFHLIRSRRVDAGSSFGFCGTSFSLYRLLKYVVFKLFPVHSFVVLKCERLSHIFIIRDILQEFCQAEPAILPALGSIIGIWQQRVDL